MPRISPDRPGPVSLVMVLIALASCLWAGSGVLFAQSTDAPPAAVAPPPGATNPPGETAPAPPAGAPTLPPAAAQPYNEGLELATAGQFAEARAKFEAAIAVVPDYAPAHYNLALVLKNVGELAGSRAAFEKALALDPSNTQIPRFLAEVRFGLGDFPAAIEAYRQAIALDTTQVALYYALAQAVEKTATAPEEVGPAIAAWQEALRRGPAEAGAFGAASTVARLSLQANRPEDALQAYNTAIRLRPDHAESHYNKAVVLNKLKRFQDAIPVLEKAIALKTPNGAAHYLLASIYYQQLKDEAKAITHFEAAAADPAYPKKADAAKYAASIKDYLEKKKAAEAEGSTGN